ncbi:unnamed protein product [Macrosiphum euphorbiae]|uniref:Uncharacterized protein n=1 Tax=Macrosiphum euphorbiae TaxID=13131 RepID=A0AAV0WFM2_9HEMI|nr:unnamed protein product [Macrosiphum euphorbiae]
MLQIKQVRDDYRELFELSIIFLGICAPNNDLQLMKTLINYGNPDISNATVKKMMGHLWYLSDELVGLCLFDQNVSVETKCKVVHAMINNPFQEVRDVLPKIKKHDLEKLRLHDLSNQNTMRVFIEFGVEKFFESDMVNWNDSKSF